MRAYLEFAVGGVPAPQGSMNARSICYQEAQRCSRCGKRHLVKINQTSASGARLKAWRDAVKAAARTARMTRLDRVTFTGPVMLTVMFRLPRPKSHYRTGKFADQLRDDAPRYPVTPPDLSKLVRSTEDALTDAGVWEDDAQVVEYGSGTKVSYAGYGESPGAMIMITEISGG